MNQDWPVYVGQRIRLYRRSLGLTTQQLARMIGKSKATVSKYESAQIALDIQTLAKIAEALRLEPAQLLEQPMAAGPPDAAGNPLGDVRKLCLYHYSEGKVHSSSLELHGGEDGPTHGTLFYKCDDLENVRQCECIYRGAIQFFDIVMSLQLQNCSNAAEQVLLTVRLPIHQASSLTGMLSGLGGNTLLPTAHKVILSKAPLAVDDVLVSRLLIPPESFREMKRKNTLFVPLE